MKSKIKVRDTKKKIRRYAVIYTTAMLVFSTYFALDTFVLEKRYKAVASSVSVSNENGSDGTAKDESRLDGKSSESNTTQNGVKNDNETSSSSSLSSAESSSSTYSSNNKTVSLKTYRYNDTTVYVADVVLKDGAVINSALADNSYGRNITDTTYNMAQENGAILAINGDYYGSRESGYVIRNGQLLRSESAGDDQEDLVIYKDGNMEIIKEGDISADDLLKKGAIQVMSFGPGLIEDGTVSVDEGDEVGKAMVSNPRTAIGQISDNHYVFVVADGRTSESEGLTLKEMADFMKELGVENAYNLDGGGSSTMYFNGEVVNKPTTNGNQIKERAVSDILYI